MNKTSQWLWRALWLISVVGVLTMIIVTYTHEQEARYLHNDINGTLISRTGPHFWKEKLILPFYFTFISNLLAVVTSTIVNILLIKNKHKNYDHLFRLKLVAVVGLTITFIVYWTILAPSRITHQDGITLSSNLMIHCFTPILMVATFIYEVRTNITPKYTKLKTIILLLTMPALWLIMATIMYYSLGGNYEDAIYSFLRFNQNSWYLSVLYIVGIGIGFVGFVWFYIWLNNSSKQLNKQRV